ncbi:hypothetical protein AOX55_00003194 [Sinorhizobium fredii CCBAU 25509]|nr:hypothetical protein AOX55_00003194 [Sinorhizobium fredii CCBAU 25509]
MQAFLKTRCSVLYGTNGWHDLAHEAGQRVPRVLSRRLS